MESLWGVRMKIIVQYHKTNTVLSTCSLTFSKILFPSKLMGPWGLFEVCLERGWEMSEGVMKNEQRDRKERGHGSRETKMLVWLSVTL